ncbi:flagellar basal body rod protein FlgB [Marivita lacus]|uniref:Flagellar basal body rod protein FlgB n=1 Tax=Marivita lacus TaxID=1323742 RepID=A0ABQ1KWB9_9RHOB|nr:flagellar basal body protein [Marivita lacus]GGC09876.1 flagellar basal body rod protein FlgB [Marivita lacus]
MNKISMFQMASQRLEWLSARQKVVAENIANANTPSYVGRDVQKFEDFLTGNRFGTESVKVEDTASSWGGSKDGNTVVLEEQTILASQINGQFHLASRLYRKGHDLIGLASGRR